MVQDSIEKEVRIDAPIDIVWSIVTAPEHIGSWLGNSAEVDLRPGGDMVLKFGEVGTANCTVERVERPNLFAFRWVTPEPDRDPGLQEGYATLVEFQLRAEGDGTMLRMVESGFASLAGSEEENAELAERHAGGWGSFLDSLVTYVATVEVGT
ncbi:MAG TPA: SRPBCC domain-containing protein [Solirubrobacterales bacterium]|jgi:uncharacterized protein YndB with AHSA1/START domain